MCKKDEQYPRQKGPEQLQEDGKLLEAFFQHWHLGGLGVWVFPSLLYSSTIAILSKACLSVPVVLIRTQMK